MGSNDAAEQLQVAIEVVGQLERELAKALAERDASREVNAEFLKARGAPIVDDHEVCTTELATEKDGRKKDYEWMLAKVTGMRIELDAAYALIERVLNLTGDIGPEARRILAQSPTEALAAHDREVAANTLFAVADSLRVDRHEGSTFTQIFGPGEADRASRHIERWLKRRGIEYRAVK